MKTKIVYCLVSNEKDYYYEQLLISLVSLRRHNPTANVYVVCDKDTFDTLTGVRAGVFEYATEVIPVDVPLEWHNWKRSRYIKTNLRSIISGDFLYVDVDTIICDSLNIIDSFTFDVGAVLDSHVNHPIPSKPKHYTEKWISGEAKKVGVNIVGLWHFNGGVLYVKDTKIAHKLFQKWFDNYDISQKKGSNIDQLPLMLANKEIKGVITPMDPCMNCHVIWEEGVKLLPQAKVLHYFPQQKHFILSSSWVLDPIKETGTIPNTIMRIIDNPYTFFKQHSQIIYGKSIELIQSPIMETYSRSPNLFLLFVNVSIFYHKIKDFIRNLIY